MSEVINQIIYKDFIDRLKTSDEPLYLAPYIDFMQTLDNFEDNDGNQIQTMHATNSIKWLQKFINGYMQEANFKHLNPSLKFIESNHDGLVRGSTGSNIPDFEFNLAGNTYELETKIYSTKANFEAIENGKSFHGAKFVVAFCLDDGKYYWRVRINDNVYSYSSVIANEDLTPQLKAFIGWIKLPKYQTMLRIKVPSNLTDNQLPEVANYEFYKVDSTN